MKFCRLCTQEKPEEAFSKGKGKCKSCRSLEQKARYDSDPERHRAVVKRYREANPEKAKAVQARWRARSKEHIRASARRRLYGLTTEEYDSLVKKQDGCCAVCSRNEVHLCVDHDHKTGGIRGLLCGRCNSAIGFFSDDAGLLAAAVRYLSH